MPQLFCKHTVNRAFHLGSAIVATTINRVRGRPKSPLSKHS